MILQGLFKILDSYSNEIDLFYNSIESYFKEKINGHFDQILANEEKQSQIVKELSLIVKDIFLQLGFENEYFENDLTHLFCSMEKRIGSNNIIRKDLYKETIIIIHEIFLKRIYDYLIHPNGSSFVLNLKKKGVLPLGFIIELKNFKNIIQKTPLKKENLVKYLKIRKKIIRKLLNNKHKIENIQEATGSTDKLQLIYMIYRLIEFFNLEDVFNFESIKRYIKKNKNEWLDTIPLISLKNPPLYYCGLYLAKKLEVDIDFNDIKYFLLEIYDEKIDEFEAPLVESTIPVYYFFKSAWLCDLELSIAQTNELLKGNQKHFEKHKLQTKATSHLSVILKVYKQLGVYEKIDPLKIKNIVNEINKRITSAGVRQYRDGFISSEATYYMVFYEYMMNRLNDLKDYDLLSTVVNRIYRNLEILTISKDTNFDLISELFYSCETLKLMNCIEDNCTMEHLVTHLFPEKICERVLLNHKLNENEMKIRNLRVNKITGELIH